MSIIRNIIRRTKKYKTIIRRDIEQIKELFDSYEYEEEILDFLDEMEDMMMNKYYGKVSMFENLLDREKISYIQYYLSKYTYIDYHKYHNKIKNIEYYILGQNYF